MAEPRRNPLNLLLILAGVAFAMTATAYGYAAFVAVNAAPAVAAQQATHPLVQWLRMHGDATLMGELILLAILTVGVIVSESAETKIASKEIDPRDKFYSPAIDSESRKSTTASFRPQE